MRFKYKWYDYLMFIALIYSIFFIKMGVGQKFTPFEAIKYYEKRVEINIKSKVLARKMMKMIEKHQKIHEIRQELEKIDENK